MPNVHEDVAKKYKYIDRLSGLSPERTKFVGDKKLKCPFRGLNYHVTIFCGIDRRRPPVFHGIGYGNIDSEQFSLQVERAVAKGWLRRHDVLVMNNSKVHTGGDSDDLEDWLWDRHRIYVLFLPPGTPKWNPVNAVWKDVTKAMRNLRLDPYRRHDVADATEWVMDRFTREEVVGHYSDSYKECGL
ncbi:hypothetical protein ACHAWF_003686 [Thalassiosira exigua]